jgi:hypothetical protein
MWIRSGDLLLNDESGALYRLERGWTPQIVYVSPEGAEIVVARGEEDEIERRFTLLAAELTDLDLLEADLAEAAEEVEEEVEAEEKPEEEF